MNQRQPSAPSSPARLRELDWDEISEPGCYLHIMSGMLARIYPEEIQVGRPPLPSGRSARMVHLSSHPDTPIMALRKVAYEHGFPIGF